MLTLPDPWQVTPRCSNESCEHYTADGCTNLKLAIMTDCLDYTSICDGCGDPNETCAGCRNYRS